MTSNFKIYLWKGMIRNWPLNTEDYVRANHIYGTARPLLQGGMKLRRNPAECSNTNRYITESQEYWTLFWFFIWIEWLSSIKCHPKSLSSQQKLHQIIEHSHQHLQGDRIQHRHVPRRQLVKPKYFDREHQASEFKHVWKRTTHSHHQ